ncbi:hypothetical protein SKAU_G00085940 [Synaphobranchus kaupii]|uniref:Uncharacterized protein n=1 Tax=Synaphobranchus kaupii TaxID=118154 RepID=A0A9Q1J5Z6_SYNKA|nr:hypothetical protein SKAU_G00085940 [Synaphobranchus kaupii]
MGRDPTPSHSVLQKPLQVPCHLPPTSVSQHQQLGRSVNSLSCEKHLEKHIRKNLTSCQSVKLRMNPRTEWRVTDRISVRGQVALGRFSG